MLDLIIDLGHPSAGAFAQDGGVDVLDLAQTLFIEALLDDMIRSSKVLLDFEDETGRDLAASVRIDAFRLPVIQNSFIARVIAT